MKRIFFSAALVLATLPAFAQNISTNVYDARSALSAETAELATVVAVRPVIIKNTGTNAGTWVGASVGTTAGYAFSRGSSNYMARGLGSMPGGVIGGAAGQTLGNSGGPHHAVQILVQRTLSNGHPNPQLIGVVEADDQGIRAGDRVLLIRGRQGFSVVRDGVARGTGGTSIGPETYSQGPAAYGQGVQP